MKGKKRTTKDKMLIIMEWIETDVKVAELCRKHNIAPGAFSKWKTRFIETGKRGLESRGASEAVLHQRELDKLKKIIREQTIVIEELKNMEGRTR